MPILRNDLLKIRKLLIEEIAFRSIMPERKEVVIQELKTICSCLNENDE